MLSRYYITISVLQYKKSCSAALVPSNDFKIFVTELLRMLLCNIVEDRVAGTSRVTVCRTVR
jgi:hypothetical protein